MEIMLRVARCIFLCAALLCLPTEAFVVQSPIASKTQNQNPSIADTGGGFFCKHGAPSPPRTGRSLVRAGDALLDELKSMRVKALKEELISLGVSTQDVFEKEELVQRLFQARQGMAPPSPSNGVSSTPPPPATPPPQQQQQQQQPPTQTAPHEIVMAPLYLTSLEEGTRVATKNQAEIRVGTSDHPYPSIKIQVTPTGGGPDFTLNLLLDTACSGFVLRPSVVREHNLPQLSTSVTMTGAGGVASNTGLTQLEKFRLESHVFGPLPAAVQDIGALPSSLDGIIGLSFLSQFAGVEMDFRRGSLFLFPRGRLPELPAEYEVVAEGDMKLLPLGVYSVDVFLGGRGPVPFLVDTGASDSFINWAGVESDLGIPRDSKFLAKIPTPMGAVGSDAIAMELTHRIHISSNLNLGQRLKPGLSLVDEKRLRVDIGNIAILNGIEPNGILGIDSFMKADSVRIVFQGTPCIQFLLTREGVGTPKESGAQASAGAPGNPSTPNVGRQAANQAATAPRARTSSVSASTPGVGGGFQSGNIGGQAASQSTTRRQPAPNQATPSRQPGPNQSTHSSVRPGTPAPGQAGNQRPKKGDYMNDLIVPVDDGSGMEGQVR